MEVTLIGAGRLGGALAIALSNSDFQIANIVSRSAASAAKLADLISPRPNSLVFDRIQTIELSDLVLITAPDSEISLIAARLRSTARIKSEKTIFLHTSGALSSEVLMILRSDSVKVGSLHPLVSVSDPSAGAASFTNAYFCVEGDRESVALAQRIVEALRGFSFQIPTPNKPLYHAAAVLSAGHAVALFSLAIETLTDCGLNPADAQKILLPLLASTTQNLSKQAPAAALTGTFARGDTETLNKHLANLKGKAAEKVYRELGKQSLKLAAVQNPNLNNLREMLELLEDEDQN